jgi:AraC-like DNA-binding protein
MGSESERAMFSSYRAKQASIGVRAGWIIKADLFGGGGTCDRCTTAALAPPERTAECGVASHSRFDQVIANAHAELTHLSGILGQLGCAAQLREPEGVVRPLRTHGFWGYSGEGSQAPCDNEFIDESGKALRASIYDPEGRPCASLELTRSDGERSNALDRLLRVMLEWAASAITERWFRMHYYPYWIIAARHQEAMESGIILAVDRDQVLVGADRRTRQLFDRRGRHIESRPPLSTLFSMGSAVFKDGPGPDLALRLRGLAGGSQFSVLITPPDPAALESSRDERLLLHTRPRLYGLTCSGGTPTQEQPLRPMASHVLRYVLKHIDAHLDTALSIDDLAVRARLSVSHFSRCFLKSVGITPHTYVLRRRLLRAQHLLTQSQMSLLDVALTTGFSDQSHFCRRFREFVGMTPRAFRARYR